MRLLLRQLAFIPRRWIHSYYKIKTKSEHTLASFNLALSIQISMTILGTPFDIWSNDRFYLCISRDLKKFEMFLVLSVDNIWKYWRCSTEITAQVFNSFLLIHYFSLIDYVSGFNLTQQKQMTRERKTVSAISFKRSYLKKI